jgi:hypothetical protein
MKTTTFLLATIFLSFCVLTTGRGAYAQTKPTFKVLYTFGKAGGAPTAITEVSPGNFLGVMSNSPGIFSIAGGGGFAVVYYFPPNSSGLAVLGLTPALNSQTYGANVPPGATTGPISVTTPNGTYVTTQSFTVN